MLCFKSNRVHFISIQNIRYNFRRIRKIGIYWFISRFQFMFWKSFMWNRIKIKYNFRRIRTIFSSWNSIRMCWFWRRRRFQFSNVNNRFWNTVFFISFFFVYCFCSFSTRTGNKFRLLFLLKIVSNFNPNTSPTHFEYKPNHTNDCHEYPCWKSAYIITVIILIYQKDEDERSN